MKDMKLSFEDCLFGIIGSGIAVSVLYFFIS
ncbi:hypothetical protein HNR36_002214 [Ureibacillus thermosphaericus]|uniref:Uncharacterized protein n=1 Tax=Ureibacillus thermosphaericus TaxID=51173 RepID=A0A840PYU7_URETH|nr:hypothetical protein [Ureibacillus thermosphaericus]